VNSITARAKVAVGELTADQAVDAMLVAGDRTDLVQDGDIVLCVECHEPFEVDTQRFRVKHCSAGCWNVHHATVLELDGGRTIIGVADLTPARLRELFEASGIAVDNGAGKVVPS